MYQYRSNDGLAQSNDIRFVNLWNNIVQEQNRNNSEWINHLRENGVKAAHPNHGWINREEKHFHSCYPYFNDGIEVGCFVAIGSYDKYKIVQITEIRKALFWDYNYYYQEITDEI